jgi:hypothetical protein
LACPTAPSAPIENIADISALSNPKENAANLAGSNGAQITIEAAQLPKNNSAILAARHPIIFKHWGAVA